VGVGFTRRKSHPPFPIYLMSEWGHFFQKKCVRARGGGAYLLRNSLNGGRALMGEGGSLPKVKHRRKIILKFVFL
jgi:hypothetical protein